MGSHRTGLRQLPRAHWCKLHEVGYRLAFREAMMRLNLPICQRLLQGAVGRQREDGQLLHDLRVSPAPVDTDGFLY